MIGSHYVTVLTAGWNDKQKRPKRGGEPSWGFIFLLVLLFTGFLLAGIPEGIRWMIEQY